MPPQLVLSDEKSGGAAAQQALCGIALGLEWLTENQDFGVFGDFSRESEPVSCFCGSSGASSLARPEGDRRQFGVVVGKRIFHGFCRISNKLLKMVEIVDYTGAVDIRFKQKSGILYRKRLLQTGNHHEVGEMLS